MIQGTLTSKERVESRLAGDSARNNCVESLLGGNGTLHHLGFAVSSISESAEEFCLALSARWDGQIIHDPLQRVRVAFLKPMDPRNPVFELVEPAGENSPVSNYLRKRVGLHHVCYEVDDLKSSLRAALSAGLVAVSDPKPAVAFAGRPIAWVCSRRFLLVELLERDK